MWGDQTRSKIISWPNILMLYWVAKRYDTCLNEQNVLQCLIKWRRSNCGKHDQTNGIVFGRQTIFDCVWSPVSILAELSIHVYMSFKASLLESTLGEQKCVPWLFVNESNQPNKMNEKKNTDPFFDDLSARVLTVACAHTWLSLLVDRCYDVEGNMKGMMK